MKKFDCIRFSTEGMEELSKIQAKSRSTGMVFWFLLEKIDFNNNDVVVTREEMAKALNLSKASISKAVKILDEANFIKIIKDGNSNIYRVNSNVVTRKMVSRP